jgi:hypothetical protein
MTSAEAAAAVAHPIERAGGAWLLDADVLEEGKAAGHPNGYAYYITGRGGVLGDVDADVVVSAFTFFGPALIRTMWEKGVVVEGARAAARRYTHACGRFGRTHLAEWQGAGRFAELAERVVAGVDAAGLALFAGWRAEPLPDDAPARAYQLAHVLRELRGSQHIVGVVAVGLSPFMAVVATSGEEVARKFGWTDEVGDVDAAVALKARAEEITAAQSTQAFSVLNADELEEFVALSNELFGAIAH